MTGRTPPAGPADIDLFDPAVQEDWYPTYDWLRSNSPVWQLPGTRTFFLTRYEDVTHVLRRPDLFRRGQGDDTPVKSRPTRSAAIYEQRGWPPRLPLAIDPPDHRRYRELVDPFFSNQGAARRRELIERVTNDLIDGFCAGGRCEFVREFALPLPVQIITVLLGFDVADIPELKAWSEAWVLPFRGPLSEEEEIWVAERRVEFQHHIHDTIEQKRRRPDDSVISYLANDARFGGERPLEDGEIIGMIDHLYIGGNETTTFALTSGLWLLLSVPGVYDAVRRERTKVRNLVEEVLRLESPTQGLPRVAARDTDIGGVPIPAGATVHLRYAAANRDPEMFPDPEVLDLTRPNSARHVAFSLGETHCPGAGLSRLEQVVALEALVDRLPDLHLLPGNDFKHHSNFTLRAMKELHIGFTPVHPVATPGDPEGSGTPPPPAS
ncbi:MAG TPA: cytochrome P450 [Acidimicrobiales bacterium]|nr:cytochrome P450 [Acidimicrobiales bacterium]